MAKYEKLNDALSSRLKAFLSHFSFIKIVSLKYKFFKQTKIASRAFFLLLTAFLELKQFRITGRLSKKNEASLVL